MGMSVIYFNQPIEITKHHWPVLDPRFKLRYFSDADWSPDWIMKAEHLTRDAYEHWRTRGDTDEEEEEEHVEAEEEAQSEQHANTFSNLGRRGLARKPSAVSSADELTHYLAAPCENLADEDVLDWWELKMAKYPHLYLMATSYLTAPGALSLLLLCSHAHFPFPQEHLSTSSAPSHVGGSCCLTSVIVSRPNVHARSSALGNGRVSAGSWTRTYTLQPLSRRTRMTTSRIGATSSRVPSRGNHCIKFVFYSKKIVQVPTT